MFGWDFETWHYAKHAPRSVAQGTFDVHLSFWDGHYVLDYSLFNAR